MTYNGRPFREPFDGVWDRIERAQTHRKTFGEEWAEFCDGQDYPYPPGVRVDDDGKGTIWVDCEPLPPSLPLLLGEMLYQLRAALDGCIYEAAILETGEDPPPDHQHLGWPLCGSKGSFKSQLRSIAPLSEQRRAFIEGVQPYKAGQVAHPAVRKINTTLGMLNDWARKDRHRTLHVVGSWGSRIEPLLDLPDGVTCVEMEITGEGLLEGKSEIASFTLAGWESGMQIEANPNLLIDIAIDEIPAPRDPDDTLGRRTQEMCLYTDIVTRAMAKSFGFGFLPGESREPPS